jgi:hypothetical protein
LFVCFFVFVLFCFVCYIAQAGLELKILLPQPPSRVLGLQKCATTPAFAGGFQGCFSFLEAEKGN